jgi:dipeptidyl aminopeptidase/acylaminoacyl peptidase
MFTVGWDGATSFDEGSIGYAPLDGRAHRLVLQHATDGRLLANGHLAWARGGSIMTAPFDPAALAVAGLPRLAQSGVAMAATGVAHFACSNDGVLVHLAGEPETLRRSLVTVNMEGRVTGRFASGEALEEPRLAPDGCTAIISIRSRRSDLWLYDFTRGALARLTFEGENFAGIWGPGPAMLTFSSSQGGSPSDLYCAYTDRSATPELLVSSEFDKAPNCWSPDGGLLLFTEYHPDTGADIWVLDRARESARPLVRTRFNEYTPALSPDGRYAAYTTDESGRPEIQIVSFPEGIGRRQVSTDGGSEPLWSRDGGELFYRAGDRLMRIDMNRGADTPGIPTTAFEGRFVPGAVTLANYDVAPDGASFVMVQADAPTPPSSLCVTLGWFGEVTRGSG